MLLGSSHSCHIEVTHSIIYSNFAQPLTTYFYCAYEKNLRLAKGIEEFVFWGGDNADTHNAKQELLEQMMNFDIAIKAKGFFGLDRPFLATVSN